MDCLNCPAVVHQNTPSYFRCDTKWTFSPLYLLHTEAGMFWRKGARSHSNQRNPVSPWCSQASKYSTSGSLGCISALSCKNTLSSRGSGGRWAKLDQLFTNEVVQSLFVICSFLPPWSKHTTIGANTGSLNQQHSFVPSAQRWKQNEIQNSQVWKTPNWHLRGGALTEWTRPCRWWWVNPCFSGHCRDTCRFLGKTHFLLVGPENEDSMYLEHIPFQV